MYSTKTLQSSQAWKIPEKVLEYTRKSPGMYQAKSWNIPGKVLEYTWKSPGIYQKKSWNIPGKVLEYTRKSTGIYLEKSWNIVYQKKSWNIPRKVPGGIYLEKSWRFVLTKGKELGKRNFMIHQFLSMSLGHGFCRMWLWKVRERSWKLDVQYMYVCKP